MNRTAQSHHLGGQRIAKGKMLTEPASIYDERRVAPPLGRKRVACTARNRGSLCPRESLGAARTLTAIFGLGDRSTVVVRSRCSGEAWELRPDAHSESSDRSPGSAFLNRPPRREPGIPASCRVSVRVLMI